MCILSEVSGSPFDMADIDRPAQFRLTVAAPVFTGSRADPAKDPRQDVCQAVDLIRPVIAFFKQAPDVGRDIGLSGAGALTGDIDVHIEEIFRIG